MKQSKYPFYYYLALVAFVLLSVLFWIFFLTTGTVVRRGQIKAAPIEHKRTTATTLQTTSIVYLDPLPLA
ncbi:hypothetical protein [Sphingobacterium sp.]|uniref:hypothetical protein n=1 Tax=Sphingobacterium sp. TaxID=341027 RepID=UPI00259432C7|nr:hypothetical protein [Sphingobacterium sp.]